MTTAVQPVPVDGKSKEGPNKVLLAVLGVVAAAALFMFVVKPLLLDSKEAPKAAPATTAAPSGGSTAGAQGNATTQSTLPGKTSTGSASGTGTAGAAPGTGDGGDSAPAPATVNPQADSLPQIPAQYAGQAARDPFVALAQTGGTSSGTSTSTSK